jgi:hypothetical protein
MFVTDGVGKGKSEGKESKVYPRTGQEGLEVE